MEKRFDPTKKENWNILNTREIAKYLRYFCTNRFKAELNEFILKYVLEAKVEQYIGPVATKHFSEVNPPLRQIK